MDAAVELLTSLLIHETMHLLKGQSSATANALAVCRAIFCVVVCCCRPHPSRAGLDPIKHTSVLGVNEMPTVASDTACVHQGSMTPDAHQGSETPDALESASSGSLKPHGCSHRRLIIPCGSCAEAECRRKGEAALHRAACGWHGVR